MIQEAIHLGNPLARMQAHLPELRKHVQGLTARMARDIQFEQKDEIALEKVLGMPKEFLPPRAWARAERLQTEGRNAAQDKPEQYFGKFQGFLNDIISHGEAAQRHWLHILEHGTEPAEAAGSEWAGLRNSAQKRRQRLARLMHKYLSSGVWTRNQMPVKSAREVWNELKRMKLLEPNALLQLKRNEKHGIDPNMFMTRLAEKANVHTGLELPIMRRWTFETLEKIVGKPIPGSGYR